MVSRRFGSRAAGSSTILPGTIHAFECCVRRLVGRLSVVLLFVVGCWSEGGSGSAPAAGSGGADASPGTGDGGDACANLACLQEMQQLMLSCAAEGACVVQTEPAPATEPMTSKDYCYYNGVRLLDTTETD